MIRREGRASHNKQKIVSARLYGMERDFQQGSLSAVVEAFAPRETGQAPSLHERDTTIVL